MDGAEEVSVLVYDVDMVIVTVRYQDISLAVCDDDEWTERFPGSRGRTGVSKAEFAGRIDHHYCMGVTVSHSDVQVPVLTDVFICIR